MFSLKLFFLFFSLIFIFSCSSSYEKLSTNTFDSPNIFSKYLLETYKTKADFEANEMHDWNSAKLYSEKALDATKGKEIKPEKISYWNIPSDKLSELNIAYENLMAVYNEALSLDPYNLAKAISSLDCWAEQQEENWQTWDIKKCRDDFLSAMHELYGSLSTKIEDTLKENLNTEDPKIDSASVVTQDTENNILQIIYFDFDKSELSNVSINEIKKFINTNGDKIEKFIVIGHTDTKGTKQYNKKLSLERAQAVEKILLDLGIVKKNISLLAQGEDNLRINTPDEIAHPANRRAEISPLN